MSSFHRALMAEQRGALATAVDLYLEALSEDPESVIAHARLSLVLGQLGRLHGAMSEARAAVALKPENGLALQALAMAALRLGDDPLARRTSEEMSRLAPNSPEGHLIRCGVARKNRDAKKLEASARKALSLAPYSQEAKYYLAAAALMRRDDSMAEAFAREILSANPRDPAGHVMIGEAFLMRRDYDKARDAAMSALFIDPMDKEGLPLLARVEARRKPFVGWVHGVLIWLDALPLAKALAYFAIPLVLFLCAADYAKIRDWNEARAFFNYFPIVLLTISGCFYFPLKRRMERDLRKAKLRTDY